MKNILVCLLLMALFSISVKAHGLAVHVSLYDRIVQYYHDNYSGGDPEWEYLELIETYPEYFKYGSILPDMQYTNSQKPVLQALYDEIENTFPAPGNLILYGAPSLEDVPDPVENDPFSSYSFGINTHDYRYAFQFAQYLLNQAALSDPPGMDYGFVGTDACITRGQKLALAVGYFAHLCEDVISHNYWVPQLTAQSGLAELLVVLKESSDLGHIPGIQSHYAIEANHDYRLGNAACNQVENVVLNGVWIRIGADPDPPAVFYLPSTDTISDWGTANPVLVFFHEVLTGWINSNPYNLPNDFTVGEPISLIGFLNECSMWRYGNRFYSELFGYGSFSDTFANFLANHIHFEAEALNIIDAWGFDEAFLYAVNLYNDFRDNRLLSTNFTGVLADEISETASEKSIEAFQTLLGMMRNNIIQADQLASSRPDLINIDEYNRLKNNPVFTDANYFDGFSYYAGVEAQYFDKIGPGDNIYETWAPDYHNSYVFGVMNSLNGYSADHEMTSTLGVYDAYFLIDGERYNGVNLPIGSDHNFEAVAEVFSLGEMSEPLPISAKLVLDHIDGNENDLVFRTVSSSIQQSPFDYNTENRLFISVPFNGADIGAITNLQLYQGLHVELYAGSSMAPFFTTDWDSYANLPIVMENDRYDQYDSYDASPFSYAMNSMNIKFSSFFGSHELDDNVIKVNGVDMLSGASDSFVLHDVIEANIERDTIEYDEAILIQHHNWNGIQADHFSSITLEVIPSAGSHQKAKYEETKQVQISSDEGITFHDPWYIENPAATPEDWIQPDDFRPLSEQLDENGNVQVFLNQNENFYDGIPIYQLQAPQLTDAGNGEYFIFDYWDGSNVLYGVNQSTTNEHETPVVFTSTNATPTPNFNHLTVIGSAGVGMSGNLVNIWVPKFQVNTSSIYEFTSWTGSGVTFANPNSRQTSITFVDSEAEIEAQYIRVDNIQNYTISVSSGSTLDIPDGANYNFADGVSIEVAGNFSVGVWSGISGERNSFTSTGTWKGIKATSPDADISIYYTTIEDAVNPDHDFCSVYSFMGDLSIAYSKFKDSGGIISMNDRDVRINHNEFSHTSPQMDYPTISITNASGLLEGPAEITNNTFINCGIGIEIPEFWHSDVIYLLNNIFYFDAEQFNNSGTVVLGNHDLERTPGASSLNYNLMFGYDDYGFAGIETGYWTTGRILSDPLFQNKVLEDYRLTPSSPAIDMADPSQMYNDPDETRGDLGAYYLHQLSGAITQDLTLDVLSNIVDNTTINSGVTLTIMPGTRLSVNPDKVLKVYGTLVAEGTVTEPIEFVANAVNPTDSYWSGIQVHTNGEAWLDHVNVHHAEYGIEYNYATGTVNNSLFEYGEFGLYAYQSNVRTVADNVFQHQLFGAVLGVSSTNTAFNNNTVTECTFGLQYNGANGKISGNTFSNIAKEGILFSNNAQGNLTTLRFTSDSDPAKNNRFTGNATGIRILSDAAPLLGNYVDLGGKIIGGYNEFTNNTWNGINKTSSTIDARVNWTGGSWSGGFLLTPTVDDIHGGISKRSSDDDLTQNEIALHRAQALQLDSLWVEAVELYDSLITNVLADSIALYALIGLNFCYEEVEDNDLGLYLENLTQTYPGTVVGRESLDLLISRQAAVRNFDPALEHSLVLIDEYGQLSDADEDLAFALFERQIILDEVADEEGLEKTAKQAESIRERVVNQLTHTVAARLVMALYDMQPEPIVAPASYSLQPVYPNPFNPVTTIRYELPKTADITIAVYDLLGRSIWIYEESAKPAGHYSLQWNGLNDNRKQVASGVYLISFSTPEFRAVQKAVLIR